MVSKLNGQQYIWSSPFDSYKRSAENSIMPLCIAFIYLTKAIDLVSRDVLFKVLPRNGCPSKLQSIIEYFYTDTQVSSSSTPNSPFLG